MISRAVPNNTRLIESEWIFCSPQKKNPEANAVSMTSFESKQHFFFASILKLDDFKQLKKIFRQNWYLFSLWTVLNWDGVMSAFDKKTKRKTLSFRENRKIMLKPSISKIKAEKRFGKLYRKIYSVESFKNWTNSVTSFLFFSMFWYAYIFDWSKSRLIRDGVYIE